jgi:signal transduction histidine kinase
MQIRNRLTLQFLLIVAGIMLVAMWYIHFQFGNHLKNEFYNNLHSKAIMTAEMVIGKTGKPPAALSPPPDAPRANITSYSENIAIYDRHDNRIYSFNPVVNNIAPATLGEIWQKKELKFEHGKFFALGLVYLQPSGEPFIVVAESVFNPEYLDNLTRILVWVFCIFMALVAIGGWVFSGQALAPMSRIMNQVDDILPTHLSQRLEPPNQKDELSRLVITFNKLLDRIQNAFNNQKQFLSNISHELKNPLNVIISQLEIVLDKDRSKEEYRQTMVSVLEDMKELNEVADKLMQLAKINSDGLAVSFQRVRIDEMIWQTKASLLKSHPEYKINFEVVNLPEDEEKLFVTGNEQLLKTALLNLMDNGCKFSPGKNVKVRLSFVREGAMAIEIQDQGPGITPEELQRVFLPFYRSPKTASVKGSGIGLSLVDSIMKLHHINLSVATYQGTGTTFKLEFPAVLSN